MQDRINLKICKLPMLYYNEQTVEKMIPVRTMLNVSNIFSSKINPDNHQKSGRSLFKSTVQKVVNESMVCK